MNIARRIKSTTTRSLGSGRKITMKKSRDITRHIEGSTERRSEGTSENGMRRVEMKCLGNSVLRQKKTEYLASIPARAADTRLARKGKLERHQKSPTACKPKRAAVRTAKLTCGTCKQVFKRMENLKKHQDSRLVCSGNLGNEDRVEAE